MNGNKIKQVFFAKKQLIRSASSSIETHWSDLVKLYSLDINIGFFFAYNAIRVILQAMTLDKK